MSSLKIILSGGGTGGHIFPAVAIANEIKKLVPKAEILFVGALGKMEMEKVPAAGYKIVGIPILGLQRKLTLSNFKLPFLLIKSLIQTKKIIKEFKPDVVIGTGGFASGPILRAANNKGIPTLIHEGNSFAGLTNKLVGSKVSKICVAYDGMEKFFPKEKIIITGNPVRQDISSVEEKRAEAIQFFKLDSNKKTILVIGGSLGAKTINEALGASISEIEKNNYQLIWQTGKAYFQTAQEQTKYFNSKNIYAFDFIYKMDLAYAAADVVISRAGASSVSEICNTGKACILVPSPNVAEDHQTKNAMALVTKNAALLVRDTEAKEKLVKETISLLANQHQLRQLKENVRKLAFLNSANVIAKEVLKLANYKI